MVPGNKSLCFTNTEKSFQWFLYETLCKNSYCQDPAGFQTDSLGHSGDRVSKGTAQTLSAMAIPTYERRNTKTNLGITFH